MTISDNGQIALCIQEYRRDYQQRERAEMDYYRRMGNLRAAIEAVALALTPRGKRHPHQYRLPLRVLQEMRDRLVSQSTALRQCRSFDEIHNLVRHCGVPGFGELAQYDAAMRLGAHLAHLPDKVYLHAGTGKGAEALGLDTSRPTLEMKELPLPLQVMEAFEVEDILCIYKARFIGQGATAGQIAVGEPYTSRRLARGGRCSAAQRPLPRYPMPAQKGRRRRYGCC